jgi:hypothetical protein
MQLPSEIFEIVKSYMLLPKDRYEMLRDIREHIVSSNLEILATIIEVVFNQKKIMVNGKMVNINTYAKSSIIPLHNRRRYLIDLTFRLIKCINPIRTELFCKQMGRYFTKSFCRHINNVLYYNKFNWTMLLDINMDICVRLRRPHTLYNVLPNGICKSRLFVKLRIIKRYLDKLLCVEYNYNTDGSYEFTENNKRYYRPNITWLENTGNTFLLLKSDMMYDMDLLNNNNLHSLPIRDYYED